MREPKPESWVRPSWSKVTYPGLMSPWVCPFRWTPYTVSPSSFAACKISDHVEYGGMGENIKALRACLSLGLQRCLGSSQDCSCGWVLIYLPDLEARSCSRAIRAMTL